MCQKCPEANAEEGADLVVTRALEEAPMDAPKGGAHWARVYVGTEDAPGLRRRSRGAEDPKNVV